MINMVNSSAAVVFIDHYPTPDEIEDHTYHHLQLFPAEYAEATSQLVRKALEFLDTCEQDQLNAHLRDGGKSCYVLVVYMQESEPFDDDEDEDEY